MKKYKINTTYLISTSQIEEDNALVDLGALIESQLKGSEATFTLTRTDDPLVFDLEIDSEFGGVLDFLEEVNYEKTIVG